MRLLHTSDWHLGRSFHQVGLLDAQARFLDFLVEVVRAERVEAVLVSGDVYDRALPSPDTVAVLDDGLTRLVEAGAQVVLSSGNHDSAIRLGFASRLLARSGVHLACRLERVGEPVLLDGLAVYPLPYLEPALAAGPLGATERTHTAVLEAAVGRVRDDQQARGIPAVVMAHAFVAGAVGSDSERDIAVGGVGVVPATIFAGLAYAALGHLHRPQAVGDGAARYSGSPLAMSFGEAGQVKSVTLLDLGPPTGGRAGAGPRLRVQQLPTPVPRPLHVLTGELETLLADPGLRAAETAWVKAVLTDPARPLGAAERLRRRFPHLLELAFEPRGATVTSVSAYAARSLRARPELDVCCEFLAHVRGGAPATAEERDLLAEAVGGSRVARAEHDDEGRAAHEGVA